MIEIIPDKNRPEISRMLTVSTIHIKPETAELLNQDADDYASTARLSLTVYTKNDFGWFLYLSNHKPDKDLPEDLKDCIAFTKKYNCNILCLDHGGPEYEDLPVYEW